MRRVERDHFDLRLNTNRKQGLQIINESIVALIGINLHCVNVLDRNAPQVANDR